MRIVQFIANSGSWGDVTYSNMRENGLGGRESALINLSEAWAQQGHEVINFVPTKGPERNFHEATGGTSYYVPSKQVVDYVPSFSADVLVSWENHQIFEKSAIYDNCGLTVIEMQVSNLYTSEESAEHTDNYAVLSNWAGEWLMTQQPLVDEDKLVVFPNGVDIYRYPQPTFGRRKDSFKFYYASSPDRGLHHLLRVWPKIRKEYPTAELHIAYGLESLIEGNQWSHMMQGDMVAQIKHLINQDGILYHGKMGQDELARMQLACDALLYPADTMAPTETGCITVVEAGAATRPVVTTSCDCLGSEFGETTAQIDLPFDDDEYVATVVDVMENEEYYEKLQRDNRSLAESRHWPLIASSWADWFDRRLEEKYGN